MEPQEKGSEIVCKVRDLFVLFIEEFSKFPNYKKNLLIIPNKRNKLLYFQIMRDIFIVSKNWNN